MSCNTTTSLAGSRLTSWGKPQTEISKKQPYSHPHYTLCLLDIYWKLDFCSSRADGVWPHLQWMPITTPPRMRWYFLLASFKLPSTVMPGQSKRLTHLPLPLHLTTGVQNQKLCFEWENLYYFLFLEPWILVALVWLWVMSWLMHLMIKVNRWCNGLMSQ